MIKRLTGIASDTLEIFVATYQYILTLGNFSVPIIMSIRNSVYVSLTVVFRMTPLLC